MARHVLIASGPCGKPGGEAAIAGAVQLLRRRAPLPIETTDPISEAAFAPAPERIGFGALAMSLADCELLCIVGTLDAPAAFENAALHVAAARLAGVPAALFAVRVTEPHDDASRALLDEILAHAEAVSAADAATSALLARSHGRRVEVACPLELLVPRPEENHTVPDHVAIEADVLRNCAPGVRATIAAELETSGFTTAHVIGEPGDASAFGSLETLPATTAAEIRAALATSRLFVCGPAPERQALAVVCRAVPVALTGAGENSPLHLRLGIASLVVRTDAGPEAVRAAFERASAFPVHELARRAATLQALAPRALGTLAGAVRARPVEPRRGHPATCDVLSRALAIVAGPALGRGDAPSAERLLDPWRAALSDRPAWAAARARAAALRGADRDACALLAHALENEPHDATCLAELARARTRLGDREGAERAWEALARLEPLSALPHAERGSLALLSGRIADALDHWTEALSRDPDHPCARGVRAFLESDPPAAVRLWRALAERHPRSSSAWYELGLATGSAGDWESARVHLERAVALDPVSGDIQEALGHAVARRDAAAARSIVDRARSIPTQPHEVAGSPSTGV